MIRRLPRRMCPVCRGTGAKARVKRRGHRLESTARVMKCRRCGGTGTLGRKGRRKK